MSFPAIGSFLGAGKVLAAFNLPLFLGSLALTGVTTAAQSGAQKLGENSGRGFLSHMLSNMLQVAFGNFSFGLSDRATKLMQAAFGGDKPLEDKDKKADKNVA